MQLSKPRVQISVDALSVQLTWGAVHGATAYRVHYTHKSQTEKINQIVTKWPSVTIKDLTPNTDYTVFVSSMNITHPGPPSILNFKTKSVHVLESIGSGDRLYTGIPISDHIDISLTGGFIGYIFGKADTGLFVDSSFYKFATFQAGYINNKTHAALQICDASGEWTLRGSILENTILQLLVLNQTGWLDCNAMYIAGIQDKDHGGRALTSSTERFLRNVTFGHIPISGNVLIRIGINNTGDRGFSGVSLITKSLQIPISRQSSHSSLT